MSKKENMKKKRVKACFCLLGSFAASWETGETCTETLSFETVLFPASEKSTCGISIVCGSLFVALTSHGMIKSSPCVPVTMHLLPHNGAVRLPCLPTLICAVF